ncbi:hypothetical protein ILYODFUR_020499 [Ilyodon furcidens]|uniref:Uncharacterized protein n=1 Tax=Ilyodon furcidens TaxID=33524 RepID=A0ABV0SPL4_9TELE
MQRMSKPLSVTLKARDKNSKQELTFLPTLKPILPFLQQRQASMRKTKVKRPEKEMATTAREDDQESSLSGAPSAGNREQSTMSAVELNAAR